jgi:hypothetical protein
MNKKLGIIVPYRNRYDHLIIFKKRIKLFLKNKGIDYELIIVEQDDAKNFNRGKLLNIGFLYAKKLKCDYVVFHDVDMVPVDVDYSYSNKPLHLATNFISPKNFERTLFDEYFGGVTMIPIDMFEQINGYSNEYWGWGYEDDDLLFRCVLNRLPLDTKEIKMMGGNTAALKFNGQNAYVEGNNIICQGKPFTIFISFYPDDIKCHHEKYDDTYAAFCVPGADLLISYNSYGRYNFEIYDDELNVIYVNSEKKVNYKTNMCVTINPDEKIINVYQDGELIGSKTYVNELFNYKRQKKFYMGIGNPEKEDESKHFSGLINSFAVFDKILEKNEILEISKNKNFGLTQEFGEYKSTDNLKLYYDAKFIKGYQLFDLSGNNNNGQIHNCEIVSYDFEETKSVFIPHRRNGTFRLTPHEENGFVNGSWKEQTTRFNQMKYYNELLRGSKNTKEDGLNNCKYKEIGHAKVNNETHVTVSI